MANETSALGALELFCSYSTDDEEYRRAFERALAGMRRAGLLSTWNFRKVAPGEHLDTQINIALKRASIIVLLVSSSFLDSDYCWDVEMRAAVERHDRGEAWIVPVIVRSCLWADAPFARLNALPKDAKPVSSWANTDEAWTDVARGIRSVVDSIKRGHHGTPIIQSSVRTSAAVPVQSRGAGSARHRKASTPRKASRWRSPSEITRLVLSRSAAEAKAVGKPLLLYENSFQRTWLVFMTGEVVCVLDDLSKPRKYNPIRWREPNKDVLPLRTRPYKSHTGVIDFGESHGNWLYSVSLHPDPKILEETVQQSLAS